MKNSSRENLRWLVALPIGSLLASAALAQQAPEPKPLTKDEQAQIAKNQAASAIDEETITLSPFTVDASSEKGYFAQNTLAGSRLKTNIADLASSISVVTKQQLEDTGSTDINEIFRYEIATEGSTTYTPGTATMRGDGVADAIGGASFGNSTSVSTNAGANRVRGLGSPTMALNYYPAISSVPFDSYNTQSVEISRGPNSMLFGMGSPAGIVNQSTASASLNKNTASAGIRVDDRGSQRANFAFNKSIIQGKLAIYGAMLYDDKAFVRKPSYDTTRRQYGAITFKPFKGTKITASIENYSNDNRRPNSLTPIDVVSQWKTAGMPVYDALNKKFKYLTTGKYTDVAYLQSANASGADAMVSWLKAQSSYNSALLKDSTVASTGIRTVTYGGVNIFSTSAFSNKYVTGTNGRVETLNPLWIPGIGANNSRAIQRISNGQLYDWQQPLAGVRPAASWGTNSAGTTYQYSVSNVTAADFLYNNATWADYNQRLSTRSANYNAPDSFVIGSYRYPGVTNKSVYDWENINASQANYGNAHNTNANIELEQEIIPGLLTFSGGWFRQKYKSLSTYTIAQLNATSLYVDTNLYNMDGTLNPYMGQVFVEDVDPDRYRNIEEVDNYRGMLAFTPDFSRDKGWTRWLGRHQFLALASYMDNTKTSYRERLSYVGGSTAGQLYYMPNPLNTAAGADTGWGYGSGTVRRYYYLSSPGDTYGSATRSSGEWNDQGGSGKVSVYDYTTSTYKTVDVETAWKVRNEHTQKSNRKLSSYSAGWTGYLWNERIVATTGIRKDINRTHGTKSYAPGAANAAYYENGEYLYDLAFNQWNDWSRVSGVTKTAGVVFKPFSKWDRISNRAASGNVFWEFVDSLGFSLNKSDNFDAPTSTNVDFYGKVLPKPQGTGKDYGIQFSLFRNKLFARFNWFEGTNDNMLVGGTAATAMARLSGHIDTDTYRSWLETLYIINQGYDPTVTDWRKAFDADAAKVSAMQDYIGKNWWGLGDWNYYGNLGGTVNATGKAKAKGQELEINFNPIPNWTMRFTGSKVSTTNSDMMKEFNAWNANRMPTWTTAKASDFLSTAYQKYANGYTNSSGQNVVLGNFWTSTNFNSNIKSDSTSGWYTPKDYYASVVTPQYALAAQKEGAQVDGQRKYNWSYLTTYNFDRGALKGWAVGGAQRWADKAVIGYYGKASGSNATYPGLLDIPDVTKPIYDDAMWYTDLWVSYSTKIMSGKVKMKIQLNVSDVFQNGELKPVAVNYDGSVSSYRIIDPRTYALTATFNF